MCHHNYHLCRESKSFNLLSSWLTWSVIFPQMWLSYARFSDRLSVGNLKQWRINETTNCFLCLALGYLNKRNSVSLEMDGLSPIHSSACLLHEAWPNHCFGLKLCSFYLYFSNMSSSPDWFFTHSFPCW